MLVSSLRQRLVIPTVLVRVIGVYAALFLLLILVVGCGGQSSTESPAPEPDPKSEPTTESGSNKQEVAIEEGSLRDLVQEQVGDFELKQVGKNTDIGGKLAVEKLVPIYVGPGGFELVHVLVTTRSPQDADKIRQAFKKDEMSVGRVVVVDERAVEASGRRVGTVTVAQEVEGGEVRAQVVAWNNGNLFAIAGIEREENAAAESDAAQSFYESVPY